MLHTLSFAVAMQLVVLNVFIISILVPISIISLSANRLLFGGMLDCYAYSSLGYQCVGTPNCSQVCAITLNIVNVVIIFAVILPMVLYFVLFGIARRSRRGIAAANDRDATFEREWRATIMFTALFLLILPVFICAGVHFLISLFIEIPAWFDIVVLGSVDVFTLLSIMDPIVIMRNRDTREVISKLIQKVCHNNNDDSQL